MATRSKTPANTIEAAANPVPTLTPEKLAELINEVTALRAQVAAKEPPATMTLAGKSEASIKNELQTIRAFKRAGFGTVTPHKDVMTFNRWVAAGFRPKEGSKSVPVNNLRLFCKAQVRPLTSEEKAKAKDQPTAAKPSKTAKVVPIHEVSPQ